MTDQGNCTGHQSVSLSPSRATHPMANFYPVKCWETFFGPHILVVISATFDVTHLPFTCNGQTFQSQFEVIISVPGVTKWSFIDVLFCVGVHFIHCEWCGCIPVILLFFPLHSSSSFFRVFKFVLGHSRVAWPTFLTGNKWNWRLVRARMPNVQRERGLTWTTLFATGSDEQLLMSKCKVPLESLK